MGIETLKTEYITALDLGTDDISSQNLRLFCKGEELKNDLFLYSYEIENDMVIQAMIKNPSP